MWPQLLALIPHLTRLVPMVDRYLQNRANAEKASEEALVAMSTALRADLTHLTTAHASFNRQLQDQSLQLAQLNDEVKRTRITLESHQNRADTAEIQLTTLTRWFKASAIGTLILLAILILLTAQLIHSR